MRGSVALLSPSATYVSRYEVMAVASLATMTAAAIYLDRVFVFVAIVLAVGLVLAIFAKPMVGLALAFALMPLEAQGRITTSEPALTWAKLALVGVAATLLVRAFVERSEFRLPPRFWVLAAMLFSAVAGTLAGGFGATLDTVKILASFAFSILVVVMTFQLVKSDSDFTLGVLGVIAGSIPVVVFGLIEVVTKEALFPNPQYQDRLYAPGTTDVFRLTSTFFDPNLLGRYLCFASLWTLAAMSLPRLARWRPLLLLILLAQLACLLNTFSRGAFATWALVGGGYLLYIAVTRWSAPRIVGLGLGAFALMAWAWPLLAITLARFNDPTAGGRFEIFTKSLPIFARSPLFGYGREHVSSALAPIYGHTIDPHNMFLEVLLAAGVVGAVLGLIWLLPLVRDLWRSARQGNPRAVVVLLPLLGVLFFNLSLHGMDGYEIWIPFAFAIPAISLGARHLEGAIA